MLSVIVANTTWCHSYNIMYITPIDMAQFIIAVQGVKLMYIAWVLMYWLYTYSHFNYIVVNTTYHISI